MKEFAFGTAAQFQALDQELTCGKKYKFPDRHLPSSCAPDTASLWFARIEGTYYIFIDKGIRTYVSHPGFRRFIETGEATFDSLDDMITFLRSLQSLFPQPIVTGWRTEGLESEEMKPSAAPASTENSVTVRNKRMLFGDRGKKAVMVRNIIK